MSMSRRRSRSPGSDPTARGSKSGRIPRVTRNTHTIEVEADSARLRMTIENVPSENPRTGRITALSVIACLNGLVAPLRVGS